MMLDNLKSISLKKILRSVITVEKFLQIVTVLGVLLLVGYLSYETVQTMRSIPTSPSDFPKRNERSPEGSLSR